MKTKVEKRIYVVLPATITTAFGTPYPISCGRAMAQACHAVSKLKIKLKMHPDEETTTVILKVNHIFELFDIRDKIEKSEVDWVEFKDTNEEVYGWKEPILTVVAAACSRKKGKSLFFGINSWTCSDD